MERSELLEKVIQGYAPYYDIERTEDEQDLLRATAAYHEHGSGYLLSKKAVLYTADKHEYVWFFSVPGLTKDDLSLSDKNKNNLVIEMVKKDEKKEEKKDRHYLRHEFSTLQFKQMFSLPENVKRESISAKVEHGILTVTLPKFTDEEKQAKSQQIAIQ